MFVFGVTCTSAKGIVGAFLEAIRQPGCFLLSCLFQMHLKAVMLLLAVVCVCCVEECVCFPNGSVAWSCGNLMPVHPPFTPSTSSPPFTLTTSSATYRPGGVISGRLHLGSNFFFFLYFTNFSLMLVSKGPNKHIDK